ncbi:hypothetical protein ElyMa_006099500 [Elysia marginata]|uniref:Uncharacterized protein n=1 Tax=Elysia marginata TaxID=1093978 RepID=A0AAV4GSV1_9GAST|nr:hypothetical protein ElyMa_006099500 [Elysia marginata]
MKCVLVLTALVAVSLAQMDSMHNLVRHEVEALLMADSSLTVDGCTTKCDALFDMIQDGDESSTDRMCSEACRCQINHDCPHDPHHHGDHTPHPHPTHPPHHTHPPHPTHP